MSDCEICGAEIRGKAQIISVGTSKLRVCSTCVRHGTVVVIKKVLGAEHRNYMNQKEQGVMFA
ncbi:putative translation factor [Candidatus Methanophagaceae archaeon]|nr:putative translation factor [Methanophagales archaeon]